MKISNKDLIQSYIFTMAVFDFNVHERRIMYRIVENCQYALEGQKLGAGIIINKTLWEEREFKMPITYFFKEGEKNHYSEVTKALLALNEKKIVYEDADQWKVIRIIEKPKFQKKTGVVEFEIQPEIYNALLNFSKGFRKYDIGIVMQLESVYAMRFYEMFAYQNSPITYDIGFLKKVFNVEDKYKLTADFIKRIVAYGKKELDKRSPYSFEYKLIKAGRKITHIQFTPIKVVENVNIEFEKIKLQRMLSPSFLIPKNSIEYLKNNFGFDTKEIKNNMKLLDEASKIMDLEQFLCNKKTQVEGKRNPKGWIINAIKEEIKNHKTNKS